VFKEGEIGSHAFVILDGEIHIFKEDDVQLRKDEA
jgi:hypothetical protein